MLHLWAVGILGRRNVREIGGRSGKISWHSSSSGIASLKGTRGFLINWMPQKWVAAL